MKKIFFLMLMFLILSVSACKSGDKEITYKIPSADTFITAEDVESLALYTPVKTLENTRGKSVVKYYPEVLGESDPVIVEVYSHNEKISVAEIHEKFLDKKEARTSAYEIDGIKSEGFIAYPSANLYRDGYMLVITAGSGAEDSQGEMLKEFLKIADENLDKFLEENPTDSDLLN